MWASSDYSAQGFRPNQMYEIATPSGIRHKPPTGNCWKNVEEVFLQLVADNRIWFGKDGKGVPRRKTFLAESEGISAWSWWENAETGHNQEAKKEVISLFGITNPFDTPKPERLIQRILHLATNENDLVLDSFLGSGTTAAVAHKMNRRYIGIEMGEHAQTHCQPRLKKVIEGEQGGISVSVNWNGGGGFSYYRLGESVFDEHGHIRADIDFATLAAHVWFTETRQSLIEKPNSPFLGIHNGTAYYLLFNGILGDRKPRNGNVLTQAVLNDLYQHDGQKIVFGESCRLREPRLQVEQITFKQIPYSIKVG